MLSILLLLFVYLLIFFYFYFFLLLWVITCLQGGSSLPELYSHVKSTSCSSTDSSIFPRGEKVMKLPFTQRQERPYSKNNQRQLNTVDFFFFFYPKQKVSNKKVKIKQANIYRNRISCVYCYTQPSSPDHIEY